MGERLIRAAVWILPLVCWPGLEQPFSVPKLWLLAGLDVLILAVAFGARTRWPGPVAEDWPVLTWVAAVSTAALLCARPALDALLLALAPVPVYYAVSRSLVSRRDVLDALFWAAVAQAGVAVLQFAHADPLGWLGWRAETFANPRMRVYGTLGNPNFVAAWCGAVLPVVWEKLAVGRGGDRRGRTMALGAVLLLLGAMAATGSRVVLLILPVEAAVLAFYRRTPRYVWLLAIPLAAALWLAPARPLVETVRGRFYLLQVAAGYWKEFSLGGQGPGAFEQRFAAWQAAWLDKHAVEPAAARFAGPVDHAHNDYLEFLVEYGVFGLGALAALCARLLWCTGRVPGRRCSAAAAGLAGLLAAACVDFPLHRPAEWCLFWVFSGCLASLRAAPDSSTEADKERRECRVHSNSW